MQASSEATRPISGWDIRFLGQKIGPYEPHKSETNFDNVLCDIIDHSCRSEYLPPHQASSIKHQASRIEDQGSSRPPRTIQNLAHEAMDSVCQTSCLYPIHVTVILDCSLD